MILNLVEIGQLEMVRSPIDDLENSGNSLESRRLWVEQCLKLASQDAPLASGIKQRAGDLEMIGVKPIDALQAAAAESAAFTHLLTCDDRFRKRYTGPLKILNPADFVVTYFQQGS